MRLSIGLCDETFYPRICETSRAGSNWLCGHGCRPGLVAALICQTLVLRAEPTRTAPRPLDEPAGATDRGSGLNSWVSAAITRFVQIGHVAAKRNGIALGDPALDALSCTPPPRLHTPRDPDLAFRH